jgi:hypothetical protein
MPGESAVSAERRVVRQAAQLVALANGLRNDLHDDDHALPHPIHWPSLTAEEAEHEWDELRHWVERLRARFPNLTRLPDCWWQHNDLVEVLAALRDYERASFSPTAPATAAVEWQRALRDMEIRIEIWIKRFTCTVPGRGHTFPDPIDVTPDGWGEHVRRDVYRRRSHRAQESA